MKKVIIVDDHAMIRNGIKTWLTANSDWRVVAEADSAASFFAQLDSRADELSAAIVDINIGTDNGFDIIRTAGYTHPAVPCLVYSMYDSAGYVLSALDAGAKGYVTKGANERELISALDEVAAGRTYVEQSLIPNMSITANLFSGMTKAEKKVLEFVREGRDNQTIACTLGVSRHTVENYLSRIYDKLGINSREALLVRMGVKQ